MKELEQLFSGSNHQQGDEILKQVIASFQFTELQYLDNLLDKARGSNT